MPYDTWQAPSTGTLVVELALFGLFVVGAWRVFQKAGKPGWAAIIPIYNVVVLLQITGKPIWWLVLYFVPLVNVVFDILVSLEVARRFGKGLAFGLGLAFLPFIFYPVLGFGDAQYLGSAPAAASAAF
jgi:hypothetical protein